MDCNSARLYLHFARPPGPGELAAAEAQDLGVHLARCRECAALARTERDLDQQLGRAMRQVEVPGDLRGRLLARLAAERDARHRRWLAHGLRGAAAAAAVLLAVWGWLTWGPHSKPEIDLEAAFAQVNVSRPSPGEVEASLKELGVDVRLPGDLNYAFLNAFGVTELPGKKGKKVAQLVFVQPESQHTRNDGAPARLAFVYLVSAKDFNLQSLATPPALPTGYLYKLQAPYEPGNPHASLIFYTGDNIDWLFRKT
jgi:hypothetical protein